jgi:hypothetical protein
VQNSTIFLEKFDNILANNPYKQKKLISQIQVAHIICIDDNKLDNTAVGISLSIARKLQLTSELLYTVPKVPKVDFCKSEVVLSATHGRSNFCLKICAFFCAEGGFSLSTYMNLGLRSRSHSF